MKDENKKMFDYNLVRFLVTIIDVKSMSAAAEQLGLAPSGVSYAVNKLRKHYNDILFIKSKKGIQPTPLAIKLYDLYLPIIKSMELASDLHQLENDHQLTRKIYNINANSITEYWLTFNAVVKSVIFDNYALRFVSPLQDPDTRITRLRRKEIDLDIGFGLPRDANIYSEFLFECELVMVCSRTHPRVGIKITEQQFLAEKHLSWNSSGYFSELSTSIETLWAERGKHEWIVSDSSISMLKVVSQSELLMFVPDFFISFIEAEFPIKEVKAEFLPSRKVRVYAYMHKALVNDPVIRQLVDMLKENVATDSKGKE
ncbi:LysR family transcriptional regulator [Serratia fonticola]